MYISCPTANNTIDHNYKLIFVFQYYILILVYSCNNKTFVQGARSIKKIYNICMFNIYNIHIYTIYSTVYLYIRKYKKIYVPKIYL